MVLMGDLKVDFSNSAKLKKYSLMKILCDLRMVQLVNTITRPVSGTYLDHIWASHPERMNNVYTMTVGMSDHSPIFETRTYKLDNNRNNNKENEHIVMTYRNCKKLEKGKLSLKLH